MEKEVFLAVDLGAGSGRLMAGLFDGKTIELEEVSRWASNPVKVGESFHWEVNCIFDEIKNALRKAKSMYGDRIISLGIDTWGVDYGLLDASDKLINLPYIYRDSRTDGMMDAVFEKDSKDEIYKTTGIQFMFFNTIFQMMAEVKKATALEKAKHFLMMPDLFNFFLTGEKTNERTNASTTQFYDPFKRAWAFDLLEKIGAKKEIFQQPFAECGTVIGDLLPSIAEEVGIKNLKIVSVASHDTGSAVAAVPSTKENPAYINSGTWCLPGIELENPLISEATFLENFTNEVGVNNTSRFLKNVTGMWLVEKSKEAWDRENCDMHYDLLRDAAIESTPMLAHINPDAKDFVMPDHMPKAIQNYCKERGFNVPNTQGEIFRCILESIALRYASVFDTIEKLSDKKFSSINVMGGGSKNALLNQFTADATQKDVYAGPVESTALGNVMMQLRASNRISSLAEGRRVIANSCTPQRFVPHKDQKDIWQKALSDFGKQL